MASIQQTAAYQGPQQASYYAQRSSPPGTLLISEATFISHDAGGYANVPGIHRLKVGKSVHAIAPKVTDAVHAKGSHISLQLYALGRVADIDFLEAQDPPSPYVSASAVTTTGKSKPPRPLTVVEIKHYIATYAKAASDAVHRAGFDGVEVHDEWGGDEERRTGFAREVVDAVVDAVGEDRVGIRISPRSTYQDMKMPDPRPMFAYLATALCDKDSKLAYLHVTEPRVSGTGDRDASHEENSDFLREIWNGGEDGEKRAFISAGGHIRESALRMAEDKGGLVAFGRLYVSNPDLPAWLQKNIPLTPSDRSKYYLEGDLTPFGYNDWPFADGRVEAADRKV